MHRRILGEAIRRKAAVYPPEDLKPEIISLKERLPDIYRNRMERAFD